MLDRDLVKLFGTETRILNQAVKRNIDRFPKDFCFILTAKEIETMVSQNVIPSKSYLGGAAAWFNSFSLIQYSLSVQRPPCLQLIDQLFQGFAVSSHGIFNYNRDSIIDCSLHKLVHLQLS